MARFDPTVDELEAWGGLDQPDPFPIELIDGLAYMVNVTDTPGQLVVDGFDCTSWTRINGID